MLRADHEPRTQRRVPFRAPAEVVFALGEDVRRRELVDGSGEGVGVLLTAADADFTPELRLEPMRFTLPLGRPILAVGVVRHRRMVALPEGIQEVAGVRLVDVDPVDRRRLEAWIRLANRAPPAVPGCTLRSLYDTVLRFDAPGGPRDRTVLRASALELDVALTDGDDDLDPETCFGAALHFDAAVVASGEAKILEIVRYRNRPVRMRLMWSRLSPEERRRLVQLAGEAAARLFS